MTYTITIDMSPQEKKDAIKRAVRSAKAKKDEKVLKRIAYYNKIKGTIQFDKTGKKSALEIQNELRNEWR